jgi:hypothetical protein
MNKPRSKPDERPRPAALQRFQHDCAAMASQMQCPLHQRAAIVDVTGDDLETIVIEVFACCEASRQRVCEAMEDLLAGIARQVHCDPV